MNYDEIRQEIDDGNLGIFDQLERYEGFFSNGNFNGDGDVYFGADLKFELLFKEGQPTC